MKDRKEQRWWRTANCNMERNKLQSSTEVPLKRSTENRERKAEREGEGGGGGGVSDRELGCSVIFSLLRVIKDWMTAPCHYFTLPDKCTQANKQPLCSHTKVTMAKEQSNRAITERKKEKRLGEKERMRVNSLSMRKQAGSNPPGCCSSSWKCTAEEWWSSEPQPTQWSDA